MYVTGYVINIGFWLAKREKILNDRRNPIPKRHVDETHLEPLIRQIFGDLPEYSFYTDRSGLFPLNENYAALHACELLKNCSCPFEEKNSESISLVILVVPMWPTTKPAAAFASLAEVRKSLPAAAAAENAAMTVSPAPV